MMVASNPKRPPQVKFDPFTTMLQTYRDKEQMLELVAATNIFVKTKSCDDQLLENEKARLERIAQKDYITESDKEYNSFIIEWLKKNMKEIIYGQKFNFDSKIPDDYYELDLDAFLRTKKS